MPNVKNYVLLETITVGAAGASSVTFNNIPQTGYTDLKLVFSLGNTGGSGTNEVVQIRFNGSSSAVYTYKTLRGTGSGAGSFDQATWGNTFIMGNYAPGTANCFSNGEVYIPNYTSSTNKSVSIDAVYDINNTTSYASLVAGLWSNTAAITSITLNYGTNNLIQYSTASLYGLAAVGTTPTIAPKAAGGDIIQTDGTYWYHAFLSSGTFTPAKSLNCDVLVVAGGGAGDNGGGGAGGVIAFSSQSILTAQTVTVGGGGATVSSGDANSSGSNSQFGSLTAAVGGGAGRYSLNGVSGGSGGGGGYPSKTGGAGTSGQGFAGGNGSTTGGGGGGGAGAVGSNASGNVGGTGGAGTNSVTNWGSLSSALTTTGTGSGGYIAGGGGGGVNSGVATVVAGGSGGGGSGNTGSTAGRPGTAPTNGVANTGSGGGGIYNNYPAGAGGSGLVIVRYLITA